MSIISRCGIVMAAVAVTAVAPADRLVKQIDHILFVTGPAGRELVAMLRDRLELPVVFDGQAQTPPSGGTAIGFGNVFLEIIPRPPAEGEPPQPGRITSLAVQSVDFAAAGESLRAGGIDHFPPSAGPAYTTIGLRGLGHPLFFIDYRHDMDARRAAFDRTLRERGGGPLGVLRMSEVAISSSNMEQARAQWSRLLGGPSPGEADLWPVGNGPAVRFVTQDDPRRGRIVVIVKDLKRAADVLGRLRIPAYTTGAGLQVDSATMRGLRLVLRE